MTIHHIILLSASLFSCLFLGTLCSTYLRDSARQYNYHTIIPRERVFCGRLCRPNMDNMDQEPIIPDENFQPPPEGQDDMPKMQLRVENPRDEYDEALLNERHGGNRPGHSRAVEQRRPQYVEEGEEIQAGALGTINDKLDRILILLTDHSRRLERLEQCLPRVLGGTSNQPLNRFQRIDRNNP